MKFYFESSPATMYNHCKEAVKHLPEEAVLEFCQRGMERMKLVIGRKYGSEIFLHESVIFLMLRRELYCQGVRTSQCYDGFWSDDPRLGALCEELLPKVAEEYRQRWCMGLAE